MGRNILSYAGSLSKVLQGYIERKKVLIYFHCFFNSVMYRRFMLHTEGLSRGFWRKVFCIIRNFTECKIIHIWKEKHLNFNILYILI